MGQFAVLYSWVRAALPILQDKAKDIALARSGTRAPCTLKVLVGEFKVRYGASAYGSDALGQAQTAIAMGQGRWP